MKTTTRLIRIAEILLNLALHKNEGIAQAQKLVKKDADAFWWS